MWNIFYLVICDCTHKRTLACTEDTFGLNLKSRTNQMIRPKKFFMVCYWFYFLSCYSTTHFEAASFNTFTNSHWFKIFTLEQVHPTHVQIKNTATFTKFSHCAWGHWTIDGWALKTCNSTADAMNLHFFGTTLSKCIFLYTPIQTGGHQHIEAETNGRHFADAIFKCIFFNENVWILIQISLKFVPKGPINNIPALVQIMAWRRPGDKPLSEPMMVSLTTHICATRPQWVKTQSNMTWYCLHHCSDSGRI